MLNSPRRIKGQALIAGMALMVIAGVVFFLMFNSGRAVNEKINLVNAADAAAFSGAQISARQLNFMAYTNRVTVANEVAIGHMVSYQAEIESVTDGLNNLGGVIGGSANLAAAALLNLFGSSMSEVVDGVQGFFKAFTGSYVLGVSANNAAYSGFMRDEYNALLGINGEDSIVDKAMQAVANQYVNRDSIVISLNSPEGELALQNSSDVVIQNRANYPDYRWSLCNLIAFSTPGQTSATAEVDDADETEFNDYCTALVNGAATPNMKGAFDNPYDDAGIMMDLLDRTSQAVSSSDWIRDRNMNYEWLFGYNARRRGETTVNWNTTTNKYEWDASGDSLDIRSDLLGFWFRMQGNSNANNNSNNLAQSGEVGFFQRGLMNRFGMCEDIDCDAIIPATDGHQAIQTYPRINQLSGGTAVITAILTQSGRCNDKWGIDDDTGAPIDRFQDDLGRFQAPCEAAASITAVSSALVSYQSPSGSQVANLFNPYWQAKLNY